MKARAPRKRVEPKAVNYDDVRKVVYEKARTGDQTPFMVKMPDGRLTLYVPLQYDQPYTPVGFKSRYDISYYMP